MIVLNAYGLSLTLGVFTACWFTSYRASKRGLDPDLVWESLPWVLLFGILGARLYHVLNFLPFYLNNFWLIPQIWLGGLGIWGAIAGGLFGLLLGFKNQNSKIKTTVQKSKSEPEKGISILNYLDCASPAIAMAQAIGRVGNVFNQENLPFAYWEILFDLVIFIFLLIVERLTLYLRARKTFNFQLSTFNLYLLGYSAVRFGLELFRTDSPWILGPLTVAGWVSLGVMGTAIMILILKGQKTLSPRKSDPGSDSS